MLDVRNDVTNGTALSGTEVRYAFRAASVGTRADRSDTGWGDHDSSTGRGGSLA